MKPPTVVPELSRFMGMANQLGKFTSNLAQLTQPLRELLSKNVALLWGPAQEEAFSAELSNPCALRPGERSEGLSRCLIFWPWSSSATE